MIALALGRNMFCKHSVWISTNAFLGCTPDPALSLRDDSDADDATFPAFHIGNRLLVRRDELLDWLEQQKVNKAQNENPKIVGSDE